MADDDLRARLNRAREYEQPAGSVTFRLRVPQQRQVMRAYRAAGADQGEAVIALLDEALLGVRGVKAYDLGLEGEDAMPDSAEIAREYLADRASVASDLAAELMRRYSERIARIEGDAKN